jgi:hypothetical protein
VGKFREPTLKDRCPQCGKQYRARSCGITHGMIRAGWVPIGDWRFIQRSEGARRSTDARGDGT